MKIRPSRLRGRKLVPLVLSLVIVAAACGSNEESDGSTDPAATTPEESTDAITEEGDGDTEASSDDTSESDGGEDDFAAAREFYEGKAIDFVVGTGTGGGYDTYARLLAPCLSDRVGARVDVRNETGAGGLVAMNNLLRAEPDGLSIGFMNGPGNVSAAIADLEGARFDMSQFTMIARYTGGTTTLATSPASGFETWEDVMNADREVIFGTTGVGSQSHLNALVVANIFEPGAGQNIVAGFDGSAEAELALLRGEIDLLAGGLDSRRQAIEDGDAIALMMIAEEPHPDFPDVPHILDFDRFDLSEDAQKALENHVAVNNLDRMLVAPGDIPDERRGLLEHAVEDCLTNDPEFQEQAEAQGRWEAISFMPGEELRAMFEQALNPSDIYRDVVVAAYE